jgi:hypothetical protein
VASASAGEVLPTIQVTVDPRVELLSIVFRLAGNPEYSHTQFESYVKDIETQFGPHRGHPVVAFAQKLRNTCGISYDAVAAMAIHISPPPELAPETDFAMRVPEPRWKPPDALTFLTLLRDFAADSKFEEFFSAHAAMYDVARTRMESLVNDSVDVPWFNALFGTPPPAAFNLIVAAGNGGSNYGPRLVHDDGGEEFFALIGVWQCDDNGMPTFDAAFTPTVIHEFSHSFVNPLVLSHLDELEESCTALFAASADAMRSQAYGNWETLAYESLVRAVVVKYILDRDGVEAAAKNIAEQEGRSFFAVEPLVAELNDYAEHRDEYKTLDNYFPRIVECFNNVAARLSIGVTDETAPPANDDGKPPEVLSTTLPNGATDVDPATTTLPITFDRPMKAAWSLVRDFNDPDASYPEVSELGFDEATMTVFTITLTLKPATTYSLYLNSDTGGAFESQAGTPLPAYNIRFTTRP